MTRLKYIILIISFIIFSRQISRGDENNDFHQIFSDSTLRIDYVFGGRKDKINISLKNESKQAGWAGRKVRLKELPVKGNGTILILEPSSRDTLYMNSFSTLFQEWLVTPEAKTRSQSFENSFLLPLPKKEAIIRIELRNNRLEAIADEEYLFQPDNELIGERGKNPNPFEYLHKGGAPEEAIDIAILSEGFTSEEMDSFIYYSNKIVDEILSYEPFASHKDKFNFVAVKVPSKESGVSIPLKGEWKDTPFGSHFSTFHSARYLTVPKVTAMHEALEGILYEHIFIIVNTSEYGGGGIYNSYQVASARNKFTLPVAVHEFGHSFAGLADEYFYANEEDDTYPIDIEPWENNITTLVDFDSKWSDKLSENISVPTPWKDNEINDNEIGVYEGGGYRLKGVYRPTITCRMRDNYFPTFCPICEEALLNTINFYTKK